VSWAVTPASSRFDGTPAAPAFIRPLWGAGSRRGGGSGDKRDQRNAVPSMTGLMASHHPKVRPTPAAAPRRRRRRPTTRPAREPCRTGPFPCEGEPAAFRLATEPGTNEYRDRPGRCSWHSRPARTSGAARVRMGVGCGSSRAVGPAAASAADNKPGRRRAEFTTTAVTQEPTQKSVTVPGKGNYCLLTLRALWGFGVFDRESCPPDYNTLALRTSVSRKSGVRQTA
jgi:hypothetical protein